MTLTIAAQYLKRLMSCTVLASLLLIATTGYATPSAKEYGTILNLSGKQRMLSQKMSKEAFLIALNVETDKNIAALKSTATLFDKTLKGLKWGDYSLGLPATEDKIILQQLTKVDVIWQELFPVIQQVYQSGAINEQQKAVIAKKNIPLLKAMNKAVGLYAKAAQETGLKTAPEMATTLNLSGKQRMLTQKMSKEFMLVALDYEFAENKLALEETYELFDRTLDGLIEGDDEFGLLETQHDYIIKQMDFVQALWLKFQPIVAKGADFGIEELSQQDIQLIAANNLPLLKEMNKAVQMYKREASK